jgi:phytoene dehydrogenase-like protein
MGPLLPRRRSSLIPHGGRRSRYDAVIVGGGHNGLVAAAYLARAGRSCLVLERREGLGGAAVSERAFPGVDARLSRYSYLVSLLPALIIEELGLPLRLMRRSVCSYTPDVRVAARRGLLVDTQDPAATRASFRAVTGSAGDHRAWDAFYAMTRRVAKAVFPTLTQPLRSRAELRALVGDDIAWHAMFEHPLGDSIAAAFGDDLVAGIVLTDALIGTFASAADADLRQNRCFLYHVIGGGTGEWQVPIGGMGALSDALAAVAHEAGAELRTRAEVLSLEPETDVVEVTFTDGTIERAVRAGHVLVNAAPAELDRLLGAAPTTRPEGAQLKVNMVLSRLPRLRDREVTPERAFAGTFHVNETAEQLQRAHDEADRGAIPATPPCESYCHSLTDPSVLGAELRAAGAHTLTVFGLHMPARLFERDPEGARAAALEATLRSLDSVLSEPISGCLFHAPGGARCLEARSPLDIEDELRMPGGHIFHRDLAWPFAEDEDEVGAWGVETTHRRIFLCGAGARRGGGVSGVPGHNAAMATLAALRADGLRQGRSSPRS